jgi:hypothetical protein
VPRVLFYGNENVSPDRVLLLRLLLLSATAHFWLEAAADLRTPYTKKFQSPRARNTGPRGLFLFEHVFRLTGLWEKEIATWLK